MSSLTAPVGAALGALGDPTRRELLEHVARSGPITATRLAPEYALTRQAVVKHLGVLCDAGVMRSERVGNEVRYALDPAALFSAAAWLASVGADWDRRLGALERHATAKAGRRIRSS